VTRAAFYYPWFPQTWGDLSDPFSNFEPSLGYYSTEHGIVQDHILQMKAAGCSAGIASWWGPESPYDANIPTLLEAAVTVPFKWALYYERESVGDPSVAQLQTDLAYVLERYASHPNYWRRNGKPVLFVYEDAADGAAMVARWTQANAGRFWLNLKVFDGFRTGTQPDSWHQYAPAASYSDSAAPYSISVSPGFWKKGEAPRLPRDTKTFRDSVRAMVAANPQLQLVTTFNEWGEGTGIELEKTLGSKAIDILGSNT
jgi:glycoprotein endo-alpha-1,2-mannosidase